MDRFADELQITVRHECPRKQPGLAQDLKPVAYAENRSSFACKPLDLCHDGGEACNRTGPEIVAVGESTREDDTGGTVEALVGMPYEFGICPCEVEGVNYVVFAVRARKHDDSDGHDVRSIE